MCGLDVNYWNFMAIEKYLASNTEHAENASAGRQGSAVEQMLRARSHGI